MNEPAETAAPSWPAAEATTPTTGLSDRDAARPVSLLATRVMDAQPPPGHGQARTDAEPTTPGTHRLDCDPAEAQRPMELATKEILLEAAKRVRLLYPGPVGELLYQELVSWLQFGYMLGSSLIYRVAEEINRTPCPTPTE